MHCAATLGCQAQPARHRVDLKRGRIPEQQILGRTQPALAPSRSGRKLFSVEVVEQDPVEDLKHARLLDHVRVDKVMPDHRLARTICQRIDVIRDPRELALKSRRGLSGDNFNGEGRTRERASRADVLGEVCFLENARKLNRMQLEDLRRTRL